MSFVRRLLVKLRLLSDPSVDASIVLTEQVLDSFRDQDTARLRYFLPWPLRFFLSDKRGKELWSKIRAITGEPKSFARPALHEDGLIRTTKALFTFERVRLGITVKLLGNSVIGVSMDAPVNLGLTPKWTAPSYVDEASFFDHEITLRGALWSKIGGTLTLPKFKGRKAAVLMLPGSGPGDRDISIGANKPFKDLSYGLASSGIVTLRMDKPMPVMLLKMLVTKTVSMYDEYIPGGLAALKYLSTHLEVDPSQIFVLGASLGGGVSPRLCAASPYPVAGMISIAGNSKSLVEAILSQMEYCQEHFPRQKDEYGAERRTLEEIEHLLQSGRATKLGKSPVDKLPIPLPMSYLIDDVAHDPVAIANTLNLPMLFVQGKDDWQVTMDHFEKWKDGIKGNSTAARTTFRLYDNVGHLMIKFKNKERGMLQYDEPGHVDEEIVKDIVQWIQQVVQS